MDNALPQEFIVIGEKMDANNATSARRVQLRARMTPEMCKAIKRQETLSGLDYWKTGFSDLKNSNDNTESHSKKPTYRKFAQINFDFPGLFLPCVDTHSMKQKQKEMKKYPAPLSRAKTSLAPEIKTGHKSVVRQKSDNQDNHNPSKKATVTDLTCLQLADTLLSYKSPFSGFYGTSPGIYNTPSLRSRYVELFNGDNSDKEQQIASDETTRKSESGEDEGVSKFSYYTCKSDNKNINAESQSAIKDTCVTYLPTVDSMPESKPQKSILKNGLNKLNRPSSETVISHTISTSERPSVCSYQLPKAKTYIRSVSETRLPTTSLYPKIQNDLQDFGRFFYGNRHFPAEEFAGSVRSIPVRLEREHTHSGEFSDFSVRKRSVRFNAAHEVREYTPCEPISFC